MIDSVGCNLDAGPVHLQQLASRHVAWAVDEPADDVRDCGEAMRLEDREGRRVKVLVAVVERDHDRPGGKRRAAGEIGASLVEIHRVIVVRVQPVHLGLEVLRRDRELESDHVGADRRRLADVVIHEDWKADRGGAQRNDVSVRNEIFAVAVTGLDRQYRRKLHRGHRQRGRGEWPRIVCLQQVGGGKQQGRRDSDAPGDMPHGR